jgi:hypothetical protein
MYIKNKMNIEKIKKEIRTEFARSGGKAKAKKMTTEERSAHGKMMAKARKTKGKVIHR